MSSGPLQAILDALPPHLRGVIERETPIPSIAQRAGEIRADHPELVRADIGQITGLDDQLEVLYGAPVGLDRVRDLVAETWNRTFGLTDRPGFAGGLTRANIAITTGAAEALSTALRAVAFEKRVAIPVAHWENYRNAVEAAGGEVVPVEFFDESGVLDLDGLRRTVERNQIRVVLANFPANPTGAVLNREEAEALGAWMRELGLIVIADEVYARLRFDGVAPESLITHAPENVISVSSASKEYLLPGARVGYAICAQSAITDRVLRKLIRTGTGSPNVLGQQRLLEFLEPDVDDLRAGRPPRLLTRVRDEMAQRLAGLRDVLTRHGFTLRGRPGHPPQGTIFLMAGLPDWFSGDDTAFAQRALDAACVSTVPGSAFGMPGAVRFSFGGLTPALIEQLDRNLATFRTREMG